MLAFAAAGCASRSAGAQSTACKAQGKPGCSRFAQETRGRWKREQTHREDESRRNAMIAGDHPPTSGGR
jgi:hypothetical protein